MTTTLIIAWTDPLPGEMSWAQCPICNLAMPANEEAAYGAHENCRIGNRPGSSELQGMLLMREIGLRGENRHIIRKSTNQS